MRTVCVWCLADCARVSRLGRVLTAVAAGVALGVSACGASASARLSNDLIPVSAVQSAPWGLRIASSAHALNPYGVQPSGASLATANAARAEAVATRQWVDGSGALATGPLPEGILSIIDSAAHFRSAADAEALVADLSSGYGTRSSQPVAGSPGTTLLSAPFTAAVPGGHITGHQELVVIERGGYVFTVLVVGGGSRPTASDAHALATLQSAAIPAPLS